MKKKILARKGDLEKAMEIALKTCNEKKAQAKKLSEEAQVYYNKALECKISIAELDYLLGE